jgi:outer membrane protein OmpA-like peptidoglycan-associated protein/tetratricopeptide (TPR) repeat protein
MKILLHSLLLLTFVSCSVAQTGYSTTNKKAIALFEKARKAPSAKLNPVTMQPDYATGIVLAEKALSKDSNFVEAHLLAGDFADYSNNVDKAIFHFKKAIQLNPNHSPSGATHYLLGNMFFETGQYQEAITILSTFVANKNANPDYVTDAYHIIESAEFALNAIKNPVQFNPINLGPGVNTADPEYFPTITVDGQTILFTRLVTDERVQNPNKKQEDFFVSNLSKNTNLSKNRVWEKAFPMPASINTVQNEGAPTISADGRSLIFVACAMNDAGEYGENRQGKGSCDLFITKRLGNRWSDPENLPGYVNSNKWESQPSLSADGKTLYFIRGLKNKKQQNDADIFVSTLLDDGRWGPPTRLPNTINTDETEESVLIHPDGKTLYFSSRGHKGLGGLDIYLSRMDENGNWGTPINLGYPINTRFDENSLMVDAQGDLAFFASNRTGGYGDLDIYYFELPEQFKPVKTLYFDGFVFDKTTKNPIAGKFSLIDLKTGKEVVRAEADRISGIFTVSLPINCDYALNVSYPGYNFYSANFNLKLEENQEIFHMDIPLIPVNSIETITLNNVFFALNQALLQQESFVELAKLSSFLKINTTLSIEIGGHTDTRGDEKENMKLSEARAKVVVDYLISQGIEAKRLHYKGYGETQPKINDVSINLLKTEKEKEKAHQQNRRTEYKILN